MKLSKRQKVCCAILALALGVLIVDRALFYPQGGPAEAFADSIQAPAERVAAHSVAYATATEYPDIQPSTAKLTQQLEALCPDDNLDFSQVRDAFSLPASWLAEVGLGNRPGSEQSTTDRFAQSHQLKAVVVDGQSRYVLVDDHFLVIGQELDGLRLVAVDEDSATFAAGGKQVVLRLASDR